MSNSVIANRQAAGARVAFYRDHAAGLALQILRLEQRAPAPQAPEPDDQTAKPFLELRQELNDVGRTGVHPVAVKALVGGYAALMAVFWLVFGGPETDLTLGVITTLATMYFGLLSWGALNSDQPARKTGLRSFSDFLNGAVRVGDGQISGNEALWQIMALPICLVVGAAAIGIVYRLAAH